MSSPPGSPIFSTYILVSVCNIEIKAKNVEKLGIGPGSEARLKGGERERKTRTEIHGCFIEAQMYYLRLKFFYTYNIESINKHVELFITSK